MNESFHYAVRTSKSVDEAVAALEESLKAHQFGVLWQLDLQTKLKEKGVTFTRPYRVLEVCNPQVAADALSANPDVGYFLPCKMVVFEEDGQTVIGLTRPTVLIDLMGDPNLSSVGERVETELKAAADAAR